jgi:protein translocase SecG subunit
LLQKGRGGGLGAAFGGGGGGHSAFGTRTGDVFTWVTIVLTGVFLLLAIGASLKFRPDQMQLQPPFFIPKGGEITRVTNVRIETTVPGAEVYYTLDGSAPTAESFKYETPIRVDPSRLTVIKAFVHHRHRIYRESEVVTVQYYGPGMAPTTTTATAPASSQPAAGPAPAATTGTGS